MSSIDQDVLMTSLQPKNQLSARGLELINLITAMANLINEYGGNIKPYSELGLERLKTFDDARVGAIYNHLLSYYNVCNDLKKQKIDLNDTKNFVRAALRCMGYRAPESFFETVGNEDLVEVYDLSHRQIFRNMKFYELTHYSLGDLLVFEWHELYSRPKSITEGMFSVIGKVTTTEEEKIPMNVSVHLMKEIMAESVHVSRVDFKFMAPIYSEITGQKGGYIANCFGENLKSEIAENSISFI